MSRTDPKRDAWVTAATAALNHYGSWTGRVHLHKHLFVIRALGLAAPPFEFVLYDYGPYSFDLDEAITDLELLGYLMRSYPQPGYGPRYGATPQGLELTTRLKSEDLEAVKRVAQEFGKRKSQELELIATCLWFKRRENVSDPEEVVRCVMQAKPKYDEATIRARFADALALMKSLQAA